MTSLERKRHKTIEEAVETLSKIAEMDVHFSKNVAWQPLSVETKPTLGKKDWIDGQDPKVLMQEVRAIFDVILHFLQKSYATEENGVLEEHNIEGIKLIMVLVGEAAKKIDEYNKFFQNKSTKSVKQLSEYKQLEEFYTKRVARRVDQSVLGNWILNLTQTTLAKSLEAERQASFSSPLTTRHIFVDLESVKKDLDYELFFIRKEDGSRFFSPRLIRNIKLVLDFESSLGKGKEEIKDPFQDLSSWENFCFQEMAKEMFRLLTPLLDEYYQESARYKSYESINATNKALMALLMARNPHSFGKSSVEYFLDFQVFLKEALLSREYQRWIAYPPTKEGGIAHIFLDLVHALLYTLFTSMHAYFRALPFFKELIQESSPSRMIYTRLQEEYVSLSSLLKKHAGGPLNKILEILEEGNYQRFDPLLQKNLPGVLYRLSLDNRELISIHCPTPTCQEYIHRVQINEEFKAFLRAYVVQEKKHLLINLQDRSSWREHARCSVLEDLQEVSKFSGHLTTITIPHDTEFYLQLPPYEDNNRMDLFLEQVKESVLDDASGYFFPREIKQVLKGDFLDQVTVGIHKIFFEEKNVLSKESRIDFLEIFHLFLYLKIFDILKVNSFSFICKDGVDISGAENTLLFVFYHLFNAQELTEEDFDKIRLMLYVTPLLLRERLMLPERFQRVLSAIQVIESRRAHLGVALFAKSVKSLLY